MKFNSLKLIQLYLLLDWDPILLFEGFEHAGVLLGFEFLLLPPQLCLVGPLFHLDERVLDHRLHLAVETMAEYSLLLQLLAIDEILVINYLRAEESFVLLKLK